MIDGLIQYDRYTRSMYGAELAALEDSPVRCWSCDKEVEADKYAEMGDGPTCLECILIARSEEQEFRVSELNSVGVRRVA